jgi:hypothetical protein
MSHRRNLAAGGYRALSSKYIPIEERTTRAMIPIAAKAGKSASPRLGAAMTTNLPVQVEALMRRAYEFAKQRLAQYQ